MSSIDFLCDLAEPATVLPHFWEHTVGRDHAPVALRADWQRQLQRCHKELGFQYVRFHGLLSDDMGTLVSEKSRLVHSFFNIDQVFGTLFLKTDLPPHSVAAITIAFARAQNT